MAVLTIPTSTTLGAYSFQVSLDSIVYRFDFQFNERESFWYFAISDEAGTVLRSGVKVVTNFPLLRLLVNTDAPPGSIMAIDPTDAEADAGLEDLGDSVLLTYVEEASLP